MAWCLVKLQGQRSFTEIENISVLIFSKTGHFRLPIYVELNGENLLSRLWIKDKLISVSKHHEGDAYGGTVLRLHALLTSAGDVR
jgi:hypothetical protein